MSHLPPRPEYPPPGKYDSRHTHARPAPMAPEHAYLPPREAYPPRSPPPRPPPQRNQANAYIAPGPYMSREPYPPPRYDRREEARHRELWDREHERRERERDRDRGYPPPPPPHHPDYRDRYREGERAWPRREQWDERDPRPGFERRREPDERAWTRRDDDDRRRERRRGPYEGDRTFYPRRSASPPRSYGSHPPRRPEPSSSTRRTPPPRWRSPSPPARRSSSPSKLRLGSHSIAASPRRRPRDDDRRDNHPTSDQRGPVRHMLRSRSRSRSRVRGSPARSARSSRRRSRSPVRRRGSSDSSYRRRMDSRGRTPTPPPLRAARDEKQRMPVDSGPEKLQEKETERVTVEESLRPSPPPSQPAPEPLKTACSLEKLPETVSIPAVHLQSHASPPVTPPIQESPALERLQPVAPAAARILSSVASPQMPSPNPVLLAKPGQSSRSSTLPEPPTPVPAVTEEQIKQFEIPPYQSWFWPTHEFTIFQSQVDGKVNRLFERRAHLESERLHLQIEGQAALQDLETSLLDVRMAEKRRKVADAQLELAREGLLGIDYDRKFSVSATILGDEAETSALAS